MGGAAGFSEWGFQPWALDDLPPGGRFGLGTRTNTEAGAGAPWSTSISTPTSPSASASRARRSSPPPPRSGGTAALACTDTNGVYGAIEFQRACEAAGVRPILGAHLVTDDEETVALATDERGWAALCRAIIADPLGEDGRRQGSDAVA